MKPYMNIFEHLTELCSAQYLKGKEGGTTANQAAVTQ